jgi:hypothetical protein
LTIAGQPGIVEHDGEHNDENAEVGKNHNCQHAYSRMTESNESCHGASRESCVDNQANQ